MAEDKSKDKAKILEEDVFPKDVVAPKSVARGQKRHIQVRRYGRAEKGKHIVLSTDGKEAFLIPVERVHGKEEFSLVIDDEVEPVYNWRDDLNSLVDSLVDAGFLALLRLHKVRKDDALTGADVQYVARAMANILNDLG